jgi:hypothetical protein
MLRTASTAALALAAGLLPAAPAPAQVVVQYDFSNTTAASTSADPSSTNPNVTGSATVSGPNILQDYSLPDYGFQVLRAAVTNTATPDEASAVAGGTYWSFTVTPNAGFAMSFSHLDFSVARGGAATPRTWYLYSSIDGFTTGSSLGSADVTTQRPTLSPATVDLSAARFQGLTGPVEYRMYISTPGTGQSLEFSNVTLNGTVAPVPEPASLALAGAAVLGWAAGRRLARRG